MGNAMKMSDFVARYGDPTIDPDKLYAIFRLIETPVRNAPYWTIATSGEILTDKWDDHETDHARMRNGNMFLSREAAEAELDRRQVMVEIRQICTRYASVVDWDSLDEKYLLAYDHTDGRLFPDNWRKTQHGGCPYFPTKEAAEEAIQTIGRAKLLRTLFNVNEREAP